MTLSNIAGERAAVYAYDPLTDAKIPVRVVGQEANSLTVELESADYPRFLMIEERQPVPGPILSGARMEKRGEDTYFTFRANAAGSAEITWGAYPVREASLFQEQYYTDIAEDTPSSTRTVDLLNGLALPEKAGVWRWTGTIVPDYSENYTFIVYSDGCEVSLQLNGLNLINGCGKPATTGSIPLTAGEAYRLDLVYTARKTTPHNVSLYWAGEHQPKEPVAASGAIPANKTVVQVAPDSPVSVKLPGFRTGDGVRVSLTNGALQTRFPFWNYDVRGVDWGQND
jgi:hypothetical protein